MATSLSLDEVLSDLEGQGYATRPFIVPAIKPLTHPTDGIEFGSSDEIWATPNTMDHLPQRSKEALKKQATTARKGRKKPANLREQVNPETVQAWKEARADNMANADSVNWHSYKNHKGDNKKIPSSGNPLATAVKHGQRPEPGIGKCPAM